MKGIVLAGLMIVAAAFSGSANAGSYSCEGGARYLPNGKCSDGSMAIYRATPMQAPEQGRDIGGRDRRDGRRDRRQEDRAGAAALFGAWTTNVAGAVWTSPSAFPGWDTLHVSPGALSGLLVIYPDGNYVWNAWGGKRGHWRYATSGDYPILLDDRSENRIWKVGVNDRRANAIYIVESNGYFYYEGRRAR